MLTALLSTLLLQSPRPIADLPFNQVAGFIHLKAHLNGLPVSAMLDTGSERSSADAALARAVGAGKRSKAYRISTFAVRPWAWRPTNLRLSLDGLKVVHEVTLATPMSGFVGDSGSRPGVLVGGDFLKNFVVEIDYPRSRLRFYDPRTYVPSPDVDALPIHLTKGVPVAALSLRLPRSKPETVRAMIDTGSSGIVLLTGAFARRERLAKRFPGAKRHGVVGQSRAKAWLIEGSTESLGSLDFEGQVVVDASKAGATGPRSPFDALLGGELFTRCSITFDYGRGRMYLGYPPEPKG